jgi:hypothetical protein
MDSRPKIHIEKPVISEPEFRRFLDTKATGSTTVDARAKTMVDAPTQHALGFSRLLQGYVH